MRPHFFRCRVSTRFLPLNEQHESVAHIFARIDPSNGRLCPLLFWGGHCVRVAGTSSLLKFWSAIVLGSHHNPTTVFFYLSDVTIRNVALPLHSFGKSPSTYFQFARHDLSSPAGVLGPLLFPPCIRHRPFFIAGNLAGCAMPRFSGTVARPHEMLAESHHQIDSGWSPTVNNSYLGAAARKCLCRSLRKCPARGLTPDRNCKYLHIDRR